MTGSLGMEDSRVYGVIYSPQELEGCGRDYAGKVKVPASLQGSVKHEFTKSV